MNGGTPMGREDRADAAQARRRYIWASFLSLPLMVIAGTLIVFWTRGSLSLPLKVLAALFVAGWVGYEIWLAVLSSRIRRLLEAEEPRRR